VWEACTVIGALFVAFNALWAAPELEHALAEIRPSAFFADAERLARLTTTRPRVVVGIRMTAAGSGAVPFESIPKADASSFLAAHSDPCGPDDDCCIFFTSGSTGFPKGAVSSHRMVLSALLSWELDSASAFLETGITPRLPVQLPVTTLLAVPLFHVTGAHAVLLSALRQQRRVALFSKKWDPEEALQWIAKYGVVNFVGPAAMSGDLLRVIEKAGGAPKCFVSLGGGGAPRDAEQVRRIGALQTVMPTTGWGMTETNAIGSGFGEVPHLYLANPDSAGRVTPTMEYRIASGSGELLVRGPSVIRRYWPDKPATDSDGWFHTGDTARISRDGHLFIVGRIKEMIIRGGENISCASVEAGLAPHPAVAECSVYGLPDTRLGEVVGATVYVREKVSAAELQAHAARSLAKFAVPSEIRVVREPLPRVASEKIDKKTIRAAHLEHLKSTRAREL
jgi:long-chain acyl-CoA synthetase